MRPLVDRWSPLTHACYCVCNSHTDQSMSKPSHAPQGILTPDALPAATLPISGLGDWLKICWLAYLEARLNVAQKRKNI